MKSTVCPSARHFVCYNCVRLIPLCCNIFWVTRCFFCYMNNCVRLICVVTMFYFFIFIATGRWTSEGARFSLRENQRHPQTAGWIQRNARQGNRSTEKQISKGGWKHQESCFAFLLIACQKRQLLDEVYKYFAPLKFMFPFCLRRWAHVAMLYVSPLPPPPDSFSLLSREGPFKHETEFTYHSDCTQ